MHLIRGMVKLLADTLFIVPNCFILDTSHAVPRCKAISDIGSSFPHNERCFSRVRIEHSFVYHDCRQIRGSP